MNNTPENAVAPAAPSGAPVVATKPVSGMVKARTTMPEVKILARLDAKGEDAFLPLIARMTGDDAFAARFVACVKLQVKNAWKKVGNGWQNDFNLVPLDSVLECLFDCATRKILPDGYNGYLVVYKGKYPKCQFLPSYRGLIAAAVSEGVIKDCNAKEVCEADEIELDWGEVTKFRIDPKKPRGAVIGCAAYAILPDGTRRSIYMSLAELNEVRACSRSDVWSAWGNEMYKKTAIRRLLKTIPVSSSRMQSILADDNAAFDLSKAGDGEPAQVTIAARPARVKALAPVDEGSGEPEPVEAESVEAEPAPEPVKAEPVGDPDEALVGDSLF